MKTKSILLILSALALFASFFSDVSAFYVTSTTPGPIVTSSGVYVAKDFVFTLSGTTYHLGNTTLATSNFSTT